jgi:hypothetical protein
MVVSAHSRAGYLLFTFCLFDFGVNDCYRNFEASKETKMLVSKEASFAQGLSRTTGQNHGLQSFAAFALFIPRFRQNLLCPTLHTGLLVLPAFGRSFFADGRNLKLKA